MRLFLALLPHCSLKWALRYAITGMRVSYKHAIEDWLMCYKPWLEMGKEAATDG